MTAGAVPLFAKRTRDASIEIITNHHLVSGGVGAVEWKVVFNEQAESVHRGEALVVGSYFVLCLIVVDYD